jgi:hypothetical protein
MTVSSPVSVFTQRASAVLAAVTLLMAMETVVGLLRACRESRDLG